MTQLLPPKKEVALALLERSNVDVYLDPRARGVVVPPQFRKEPRLILKIGLNMPVPIPDLRLDEESMSCTLSFNRSPFYCVVPWSSVFAMVGEDGRGMVWPDDVPQELAVKVGEPGADASEAPAAPASQGSRRAARGSKLADDSSPAAGAARGGKKKKAAATKKDERPRPMLVSVPSPVPPSVPAQREAEAGGDRAREAPTERRPRPAARSGGDRSERRDGVSPVPSAQASRGAPSSRIPPSPPPRPSSSPPSQGPRPKRELPPYLRVVK